MSSRPRYEQPFHWWGPGWQPRPARTLRDLLVEGALDTEQAAFLWAALARRWSLAVVGGPSGIGKSTLLAALAPFLPTESQRVYLRGSYESFAFLRDEALDPLRSVLLINEISPHLPVYLWGPAVQRALALREQGFTLLATAHARTPFEFMGLLTGGPLRIPSRHAAAFDLCLLLAADSSVPTGGRLSEIWRMQAAPPQGVTLDLVDSANTVPGIPAVELRARRNLIQRLRDDPEARFPTAQVAPESLAGGEPDHMGGLDHP